MASKRTRVEFETEDRVSPGASGHAALVALYRAKLVGIRGPFGDIAAETLDEARGVFRELPEVAGEPLAVPKVGSKRRARQRRETGDGQASGA
jgi:hypothetical protein